MEEKRREVGSTSPSPSATVSSSKNVDSPATEPPPPRRRGQKRKSTTSNSSSAPPKRHAREKAAAAAAAASGGLFSLLPPIHNGPLTRARQLSDNNAAIFSALNAVKNDHSMASVNDSSASEGREEVKAANEEHQKVEAQIDAEVHAIRTRDSNIHVVPVAAGWFSWTNIHSIEKQMMHSFFNGKTESRTPDIYKEIRNWIMKRFHANPSTNIELNDLSELSIGDIDARQEIMEFLDHWGLINYHPFAQDDSANVDADPNTDAEKENKTDSLIEKLFQFESAQSSPEPVPRANMSAATVPSGLFPESIAEELVKQEGPAVEYHCNSCSADCSRKRYHCQKQADFDLCSECYNNGKFGSGMCPSDFILMEPADVSGATGGKWTDQETLLLLEALELYKENWNEIAEHVATKTKAQCILHFLQMPIEDSFLDCDDTKDSALRNGEQPTSTNIELPVSKDYSEPSEGGISKDNSGPAEIGSGKDSSELSASKSSKENPDLLEKKTESNAAQPVSTQTETSNLEDAPEGKVVEGQADEIIIKALKEAFRVAGCPLTPEDNLSFAEAGNSVMALTAFLNQLVEPGLATVSARSSLKAISESCPNSQLAISHCFILEDPHDDEKEHVISESMTTEKIDQNAPEMAKDELIIDKKIINTKEKSTSLFDGSHSTEGQSPKEEDSNAKDDSQAPLGEQDKCSAGLPERPDEEMVQVSEKPDEKSQLKEKPDEQIPQVTEKPDEEMPQFTEKPDEEKSSVTEKSGEEKSLVTEKSGEDKSLATEKPNEEKFLISEKPDEEKSQVPEKTNKEKLTVTGKHSEINNIEQVGTKPVNKPQNCSLQNEQSQTTAKDQVTSESELMPPPALASESGDLKTSAEIQCMEATKNTVMESSCAVSDKTEQQVTAGAVPMVEAASEAGEDKMEVDKIGDTKSTKTAPQMKDEDNVTKLKRAALATLSAAAVKSKLLANQEEDEIRQLATILIEKQMRKLEVKLSYFTEMESAIMRVRDQLERSRQRLFSERAQIIASRLGIQPSSSRMLPSSYPVNRMPPGLLNSIRPPMNMVAQRPLMSKPNVTSAPPTSTSAPPEVAGGSPTQSSAIEKPSSVGQTESLK